MPSRCGGRDARPARVYVSSSLWITVDRYGEMDGTGPGWCRTLYDKHQGLGRPWLASHRTLVSLNVMYSHWKQWIAVDRCGVLSLVYIKYVGIHCAGFVMFWLEEGWELIDEVTELPAWWSAEIGLYRCCEGLKRGITSCSGWTLATRTHLENWWFIIIFRRGSYICVQKLLESTKVLVGPHNE